MEREDDNERLRRNGVSPTFSGDELDRLPPPMFPSGRGRQSLRPPAEASPPEPEEGGGVPDEAFIMPDDPIRRPAEAEASFAAAEAAARGGWDETESPEEEWAGALIDPDAPIVRREAPRMPDDYERVLRGATFTELEEGEVVVTGIGDSGWDEAQEVLEQASAPATDDPYVVELARAVRKLSEALHARGEAGLRSLPEMTRFEATLRAYCVGYLTRAREGAE